MKVNPIGRSLDRTKSYRISKMSLIRNLIAINVSDFQFFLMVNSDYI